MCIFNRQKRVQNANKAPATSATRTTSDRTKTKTPVATSARNTPTEKPKNTLKELTAKPLKPRVFDVHRKMLSGELCVDVKKTTPEKKQKEMEETMQMLGCSVINTTMIQRVEKANSQVPPESVVAQSGKFNDDRFPLAKSMRKSSIKDDDTIFPLHQKDSGGSSGKGSSAKTSTKKDEEKEVELVEEDLEEEPNSENYMYNTREIKYVNIDMIRNIDRKVIMEATGDPVMEDSEHKIEWDPYAPLNVLISRPIFDCTNLRRNTFITSAQSYPSKDEIEKKGKKGTPKKPHVVINEKPKRLAQFKPFNMGEGSMLTAVTVPSESQERVDKTPPSKTEDVPLVKSTKTKKG